MNEFDYTPKPKFDREEWEERHTNNIEWHKMWNRLFYIFIVFFIISLFMDKLLLSAIIIGAQILFTLFDLLCRYRHDKLHDELEAQDGK